MRLYLDECSSIKWVQNSLRTNSGPDLIDVQILYVPEDKQGFEYKILYKKKDIEENEKS